LAEIQSLLNKPNLNVTQEQGHGRQY
jgi:hypothetical protein